MGPHSFKCGKCQLLSKSPLLALALQWGRTLSSAESMPLVALVDQQNKASMGPHSFKCGKVAEVAEVAEKKTRLQWGRTLSSAERLR